MPERTRARTQTMAAELTLAEPCKAFDVSQEELANSRCEAGERLEDRAPRRHAAQYACCLYTRNGRRDIEIIAHFPSRGEGWASAGVASSASKKSASLIFGFLSPVARATGSFPWRSWAEVALVV